MTAEQSGEFPTIKVKKVGRLADEERLRSLFDDPEAPEKLSEILSSGERRDWYGRPIRERIDLTDEERHAARNHFGLEKSSLAPEEEVVKSALEKLQLPNIVRYSRKLTSLNLPKDPL